MQTIQTNKDIYRKLCEERSDIPLFMQAWWMDAVCKENSWDVLIYKKNGYILGVWVYHFVIKMGWRIILQPQLTQTNGIWIDKQSEFCKSDLIGYEKEIITNLISQFEKQRFTYFDQNFPSSFTNWLPFYWEGYQQTTRYTYQIKDISNPDMCFKQFKPSKRQHINKASKTLKINFSTSGINFYNLLEYSIKSNGQKVHYSKELFLNIYNSCLEKQQGCILSAIDSEGQIHAALFLVWDKHATYNLISAINPNFRSSGASSLVFWEAIKLASQQSNIFDFEGSMDPYIEKSFRDFGSTQVPYFRIIKNNSLLFKTLFQAKKWF